MKFSTKVYNNLQQRIKNEIKKLHVTILPPKSAKHVGRPLALKLIDILTLGIFRHDKCIETKQDLYDMFTMPCSYKTLVCSINRFAGYVLLLIVMMANENRKNAHIVKYTDSTTIEVCLVKNAKHHKTMRDYARWGKTRKGWFYGLKLHLTIDAEGRILSFSFTAGNVDDRKQFMLLNKLLAGVFVADSGYVSKKLAHEFFTEGVRILITKPLKKMKKLATPAQNKLYDSRAFIETVFRNLKLFDGMVSSLPRSVGGYIGNYFYAIAARMLDVKQTKAIAVI
jgi:hypothetical protein